MKGDLRMSLETSPCVGPKCQPAPVSQPVAFAGKTKPKENQDPDMNLQAIDLSKSAPTKDQGKKLDIMAE